MQPQAPLLDLGTARRIAQQHVGPNMQVTACWQPPAPMYHKPAEDSFYFTIVDNACSHIGGTRHVAVDRRTGIVIEIGTFGE